jgi:AraC family transcriptional regulator, chitin signaling transcriptional activator
MPKRLLYVILPILFHIIASAQSNSVKIKTYQKQEFNADAEFWIMCEDKDGILYFGNNDGVLVFDGEHWHKLILPNNSSVRSLTTGKNGVVYAGAYNEAGTITKDVTGQYRYTSLTGTLQLEGRNVENIWDIQPLGNKLFFRAYNELIITSGKTATRIPSATAFTFSAMVGSSYYVQENNHGILRFDAGQTEPEVVFKSEHYHNEPLAALLPGDTPGGLIAITINGLVYHADAATGTMALFASIFGTTSTDQVSGAIKYSNGSLYIGTISSGIYILSRNGEVLHNPAMLQQVPQGVIHNVFRSSNNNIWVLQNNGLAYIDFRSPYTTLFGRASVYDALVHNGSIYLATTQGIYYAPFNPAAPASPNDFIKIPGINGQTWSIQLLDGDIIAAHDTGLYKIEGETATKIAPEAGFWKVSPISGRENLFLASHYNGLYLLEKTGGSWVLHTKISGFSESARDILADDAPNTYWICHGYQGIFRIRLNQNYDRVIAVDHFTNKNGLQNSFNVNVSRWQGRVVFTTNTGIYTFNAKTNRFEPHKQLNNILDPTKNTRKLMQSGTRTWFVQDDEAGYFFTNEKKPELHKGLFLNLKGTFNRGMECLVPLQGDKMLFGTSNGLFLYAVENKLGASSINTLITGISYSKKKEHNSLPLSTNGSEPQAMPNQTDIIRFDFAAPKMPPGTQIQYSYILEGLDQEWSPWQNLSYKEYTHLRPGTYTFKVKSRNTAGLQGKEAGYTFTIPPKWYQTTLAYIIYGVLGILIIAGIRHLVKRRIRHERIKSRREAEQSKKLLELELEQLRLQRDKEAINRDKAVLEEDVIHKSKQLANYTMLLVHKKDIFNEITDDLKELKSLLRNEESRKKLLEIFQKLSRHQIGEEYMEVFDVHFEKVHHNFFERLKQLNPELTKRELRLCAFVKMNLSNKEISPLLGISLRGIENARYRIRKKLGVASEDNFTAFLENVDND